MPHSCIGGLDNVFNSLYLNIIYRSIIFQDLTNYVALAENESKARVKFNMLEKMLQPCGPPPEKKFED